MFHRHPANNCWIDSRAPSQPCRGGSMLSENTRTTVSKYAAWSRFKPLFIWAGKYPRPMFLGPWKWSWKGHREIQEPYPCKCSPGGKTGTPKRKRISGGKWRADYRRRFGRYDRSLDYRRPGISCTPCGEKWQAWRFCQEPYIHAGRQFSRKTNTLLRRKSHQSCENFHLFKKQACFPCRTSGSFQRNRSRRRRGSGCPIRCRSGGYRWSTLSA